MSQVIDPGSHADAASTAAYVAILTAELSRLAAAHGLSTLAYILEMARLEAKSIANDPVYGQGDPTADNLMLQDPTSQDPTS